MRTINWDEPLSEDDKAWARDRDMHTQIAENEAKFGGSAELKAKAAEQRGETTPEGGAPAPDETAADDYDSWKVSELRDEASTRTPAIEGAASMKKDDVIAALRQWDKDNPE